MKIYTSYFANLKKIPKDIVPIAICVSLPTWWHGLSLKKLAPTYDILMNYRNNFDEKEYIKRFYSEVLDKLDANKILDELKAMSNGKDIVLVCYESKDKFCHRHLVAEWLSKNLKEVTINEYGYCYHTDLELK